MTHLCRDSDRRFLFRGWNRLCLHAASLNAAEDIYPAVARSAAGAARAERAEIKDSEPAVGVDESKASKHAGAAARAARGAATTATERGFHQADAVSNEGAGIMPAVEEEERARLDRRNRVLGLVVRCRRPQENRASSLLASHCSCRKHSRYYQLRVCCSP